MGSQKMWNFNFLHTVTVRSMPSCSSDFCGDPR